jgi:hypothetical protein
MWLVVGVRVASAGYGDAVDGLPTWADRETFQWSNAVRIDPAAFENDYPCAFSSFTATEQSTQPLLRFNSGLSAAASYHSNDMNDQDYFDHDSIDGTPWYVRIGAYYSGGAIGENIAWGYDSPYSAVIEGWMCSAGHRQNLMSPTYNELGTGVAGLYYTQDFGDGNPPLRGTAMGLHRPEDPAADADLVVDWDGGAAPDDIYAVVNGARVDLALVLGTEGRGLYGATVDAGAGCQAYYFVATLGGASETWPEDGSYGWGDCAWDDDGARWLATQDPLPSTGTTTTTTEPTDTGSPDTTDPTDPTGGTLTTPGGTAPTADSAGDKVSTLPGCTCASATGGAPWGALFVGIGLARARRRVARSEGGRSG